MKRGKSLSQRLSRAGGDDECPMITRTHLYTSYNVTFFYLITKGVFIVFVKRVRAAD